MRKDDELLDWNVDIFITDTDLPSKSPVEAEKPVEEPIREGGLLDLEQLAYEDECAWRRKQRWLAITRRERLERAFERESWPLRRL